MDERKLGAILGYLHIALQSIVGIVYLPLLLGRLGQSEYGLYQVTASIISYVTILETMFSAAVLRHYSVFLANKDEERMENLLYVARRIFRFLSLLIVFISVPVGFLVHSFYLDAFSHAELAEMMFMFGLLIVNLIISINNNIYLTCIIAHQKYVFLKLISIASLVAQPIIILLVINRFPYAAVLAMVQVSLNAVVSCLRFIFCRNNLKIRVIHHENVDDGLLKDIAVFSFGILLTSIADQIFWKTDQIVLGKMRGPVAVAVYAVGAQLFNMYMSLANGIGSVLLPTVIEKVQQNGIHAADAFFRKIGRIQAMLLGLVMAGFVVFGKEFIRIWVGTDYYPAYWIALLLMIPYSIDIVQGAGLAILQAINKYSFRAKCMVCIAVINIALTVVLVHRLGVVGAAVSTAISIVIGPGLIINWYYQTKVGLDIPKFWRGVLPIFLLEIALCAIGFLILGIQLSNVWLTFAVHILIFSAVYIISMYVFVMNAFEKKQLFSLISRVLRHQG